MFKVGDVIRGVDSDMYYCTNVEMIKGIVLEVLDYNMMTIKILEHTNNKLVGNVCTAINNNEDFTLIEGEGNNMENNIVELYKRRKLNDLEKQCSLLIQQECDKQSDLQLKIEFIIKTAEQDLRELYMSQYNEEQLEKLNQGMIVDTSDFEFIKNGDVQLTHNLTQCRRYNQDDIDKIWNEFEVSKKELNDLVEEVQCQLNIEGNDTIDVLKRYDIIDKKSLKMVK